MKMECRLRALSRGGCHGVRLDIASPREALGDRCPLVSQPVSISGGRPPVVPGTGSVTRLPSVSLAGLAPSAAAHADSRAR